MPKLKKPLKVLIDARMVGSHGHGIATYVTALAKGITSLKNSYNAKITTKNISFLINPREKLPDIFDNYEKIACQASFLNPAELLEIPSILKKEKISLYHSPSFSSLPYYPCPHLITIHDLNHLHYGSMKEKIYYKLLLKRAAKSAAKLITISKTSQLEIARWLHCPIEKIEIAYNALKEPKASTEEEIKKTLKKFKLKKEEFFLCISNAKPHKNTSFLIEAYEKYRSENPDAWPLVLSLEGDSKNNIIYTGKLSYSQMNALMGSCAAHLFPSLYEGFGLPPLEAILLGRPSIASNIPAHREAMEPASEKLLLPLIEDFWIKAFQQAQNKRIPAPTEQSKTNLLEKYNEKQLAEKMIQLYESCL